MLRMVKYAVLPSIALCSVIGGCGKATMVEDPSVTARQTVDGSDKGDYSFPAAEEIGKDKQYYVTKPVEITETQYNVYAEEMNKSEFQIDPEDLCKLIHIDRDTQEVQPVAEFSDEFLILVYGMHGDLFYYGNEDGLVEWDTRTGKRELVVDYDENTLDNVSGIAFVDGDLPMLLTSTLDREAQTLTYAALQLMDRLVANGPEIHIAICDNPHATIVDSASEARYFTG